MEYYTRALRIKKAKEKAKLAGDEEREVVISTPETIEFSKIEAAITKLQKKFRLNQTNSLS